MDKCMRKNRYAYDITIPYNNCKMLELLLSIPIDDRIQCTVYTKVRKKMNPDIDEIEVSIVNLKHTKTCEMDENLYYILHSKILFLTVKEIYYL